MSFNADVTRIFGQVEALYGSQVPVTGDFDVDANKATSMLQNLIHSPIGATFQERQRCKLDAKTLQTAIESLKEAHKKANSVDSLIEKMKKMTIVPKTGAPLGNVFKDHLPFVLKVEIASALIANEEYNPYYPKPSTTLKDLSALLEVCPKNERRALIKRVIIQQPHLIHAMLETYSRNYDLTQLPEHLQTLLADESVRQGVTSFKCGNMTVEQIRKILQFFPKISRLDYLQRSFEVDRQETFNLLVSLPQLRVLEFPFDTRDEEIALFQNHTNVERLVLQNSPSITDVGIGYLQKMTLMKSITLCTALHVTGKLFDTLRLMPHLDTLRLVQMSLKKADFEQLALLPQLRELYLDDLPTLTDKSLAHCREMQLTHFSIRGNCSITDAGLLNLRKSIPTLQSVECNFTSISDSSLKQLFTTKGNVRLFIKDCPNVSEAEKKRLRALGHIITE